MPTNTIVWKTPSVPFATIEIIESKTNLWTWLTAAEQATLVSLEKESVKVDKTSFTDNADVKCHSHLCVLLPGNPGLVEFYNSFAIEMDKHGVDVLVMGYAGHNFVDLNDNRVFGLQEQIEVADAFITKLLASNKVKEKYGKHLYLAGHSIGGYVAMHMLARYTDFTKFFGLCAVLSNIAESPKGSRLSLWVKPYGKWLASTVALLYPLFPHKLKVKLVHSLYHDAEPAMQEKMRTHLNKANIMNVVNMFADEYRQVGHPDRVLLTSLQERMYLYYVQCDQWAPPNHALEINSLCPRLGAFVMESDEKIAHAWCLHDTSIVIEHGILPFLHETLS